MRVRPGNCGGSSFLTVKKERKLVEKKRAGDTVDLQMRDEHSEGKNEKTAYP